MRGVRSVHHVSLSIAGILALGLVVVPAFVPQELRADAASRLGGLAQYFDTMLSDAWHSAFTEQGSDHRAGVSASHSGSGSHSGAMPVLTGVEAHPSAAASESPIDISSLELGSFNAGYGAGSNSINGLLRDLLKDDNLGTSGGFEAFAGGSGGGNTLAGFGGDGDRYSGGIGGSSTGGAGRASPTRSSSSKGSLAGSAASRSRNSDGTVRVTDVKPDAHQDRVTGLGNYIVSVNNDAGASGEQVAAIESLTNKGSPAGSAASRSQNSEGTVRVTDVKSNAHQDRVTGLGNDSVSVHAAGASWEQVASGQFLLSNEPGVSNWIGGPLGGGARDALDPTNGDVVGQTLNGLDHPFQGDDQLGSVFQNEVNGSANSDGGDGHLLDFKNVPDHDPEAEDHGALNKTVVTEPGSGPVSGVPEPGSLALLSLGLGALILWGKFQSAR